MKAYQEFVTKLKRDLVIYGTNGIKAQTEDSVDNHRTPSIRQCVRFYESYGNVRAAVALEKSYALFKSKGFLKKLRKNKSRTDAFDINEYLLVISKFVEKDPALKGQFSKIVNNSNVYY